MKIKVKRLHEKALLPEFQSNGASGADIFCVEDVTLHPGEIKMVPTGISVEIPLGYEIQVRPRSGLAAKHGIAIVNSPGTIDSDYRGEIKVILANMSDKVFACESGSRIAQLVIGRVYRDFSYEEAEELETTERGSGGFGSTGIK